MTDLETLTNAYTEAIYFTETGDIGQPPATAELTPLCKAQIWDTCRNFHRAIAQEVLEFLPDLDWAQVGHDLWLTRNGHGTGFWDRPEIYGEANVKWLTAMAIAMGEHDAEFEEGQDA